MSANNSIPNSKEQTERIRRLIEAAGFLYKMQYKNLAWKYWKGSVQRIDFLVTYGDKCLALELKTQSSRSGSANIEKLPGVALNKKKLPIEMWLVTNKQNHLSGWMNALKAIEKDYGLKVVFEEDLVIELNNFFKKGGKVKWVD